MMNRTIAEWVALREEYIARGLYKVPTRRTKDGRIVEMPTRFRRWYTRQQKKKQGSKR